MYPTFVEMCGLPRVEGLEGTSLANTLHDPGQATDRDVYLPYLDPGGYAIINRQWRYIHYSDETEELYNVSKDPNEWYNLAGDAAYSEVKRMLRASAPDKFAPMGTPKKSLRLKTEGVSFHWEPKK